MATPAACPSCGRPVPPPKAPGVPITCPNPACGKTFTLAPLSAPPVAKPGARPPGSRPELLDRLELNFLSSPAMFAVGGVVTLLYTLVMFATVSGWKKQREEALANQSPPPEQVAVALPSPAPAPTPTPDTNRPPGDEPKAPEPPRVTTPDAPPKPDAPLKSGTPQDTATAKPPTRPEPPKPPVEPKAPTPAPPAAFEGWGALKIDAASPDSQFRPEASALTVVIPGSLHLLNPQVTEGNQTPPRLLTGVRGDFVAVVRVAGQVRPGTTPLPNLPFPFQGAGLLLWQDERNYLRLERSSIYSPQGKRLHQVLVELCRDGKTSPSTLRDVTDADLLLKFDRRGNEVRCSYSPDDGKTWLEIKRQSVPFPPAVKVGVSASNASPQTFSPRFEDWQLTGGGPK